MGDRADRADNHGKKTGTGDRLQVPLPVGIMLVGGWSKKDWSKNDD